MLKHQVQSFVYKNTVWNHCTRYQSVQTLGPAPFLFWLATYMDKLCLVSLFPGQIGGEFVPLSSLTCWVPHYSQCSCFQMWTHLDKFSVGKHIPWNRNAPKIIMSKKKKAHIVFTNVTPYNLYGKIKQLTSRAVVFNRLNNDANKGPA